MNLASLEDKDTRGRRATKDCRVTLGLKDYQAQVDKEASQEYWGPKVTGDLVENPVMLVLGESREARAIPAKEEPSVKPGQRE